MSSESVMLFNQLILCCCLILLPSIFPNIRVFSKELSLCIRWPKYWSFSFTSVLPMNIQSWFSLGLTVLFSLKTKGLSRVFSRATIWRHWFFSAQSSLVCSVQLSHLYLITEKKHCFDHTHLSRQRTSRLFKALPKFVIVFLPKSKRPLISWLQSPSSVILEPKKIKSVTASTFSLSIYHEVMEMDVKILVFLMLLQVSFFNLLFHTHQEAFHILFTFCH